MDLLVQPVLERFDVKTLELLSLTNKEIKDRISIEIFNREFRITNAFTEGNFNFIKETWEKEGNFLLKIVKVKKLIAYIPKDKLFILDWLIKIGLRIDYGSLFEACYLGRLDILKWADRFTNKKTDKLAQHYIDNFSTRYYDVPWIVYFYIALMEEHIHILDWLYQDGLRANFLNLALKHNKINSYKWFIKHGHVIYESDLIELIRIGDPNLLDGANFSINIRFQFNKIEDIMTIPFLKKFIEISLFPEESFLFLAEKNPKEAIEYVPRFYSTFKKREIYNSNLHDLETKNPFTKPFNEIFKILILENRVDIIKQIHPDYFYGGTLSDAIKSGNLEIIKIILKHVRPVKYDVNKLLEFNDLEINERLRSLGLIK